MHFKNPTYSQLFGGDFKRNQDIPDFQDKHK